MNTVHSLDPSCSVKDLKTGQQGCSINRQASDSTKANATYLEGTIHNTKKTNKK